MKIIQIDVMSLDGKLTRWKGQNIYEWSSPEDFDNFCKVRDENNLLVMGSGTFNAVCPKPEKERLRVIMTKNPEKYREFTIPGQMEFTDETPKNLVIRLEQLGYKQMLIVGGRKIASSFFEQKLIDELWLTIEPRIFGLGETLVNEEKMDITFQLFELKKLNEQGALLLKYKVLKKKSSFSFFLLYLLFCF